MLQVATLAEAESLCKQDPVRPAILAHWRVQENMREIYYSTLYADILYHAVGAVLCVAYLESIPIDEEELIAIPPGSNFAIFYSVWSNKKGQGKKIVNDVSRLLSSQHENIKRGMRYVTMSPKTEMAKDFHMKNGAILLQNNPLTYNFEYETNHHAQ
jgi:hypothetical protein